MFGPLKQLFDNIEELDPMEICVSIYGDKDIQAFILSKNRIDQLTKGLNANNEIIGTYSPATDIMSEGGTFVWEGVRYEKIAGEPYNFVDTGDFFGSFKVLVYDDGFAIFADDNKDGEKLTQKFGKNILGLTDDNINDLVTEMLPIFREVVRKEMLREVLP